MSEVNDKILKAHEDPVSGNLVAEFVDDTGSAAGFDLIYSDPAGVTVMTKEVLDTLYDDTKYSHLIFEITDTEFDDIEEELSDIKMFGYSMVPLPLVDPGEGGISRWYGLPLVGPVIRDGKIIAVNHSIFLEYANRRLTNYSFEPMDLGFRLAMYDNVAEGWGQFNNEHLTITKIYGVPKKATT